MKLQDHLNSTDLDMNEMQMKSFFLGIMCAERPMDFPKAFEEILSEDPNARGELEVPLKELWDNLKTNFKAELESVFPKVEEDVNSFIEVSKDQLDYFLTGMSLAGTNTENCKDSILLGFIDEFEEAVEDMDDFLADSTASAEDGEDFKDFLLETWAEFVSSKS